MKNVKHNRTVQKMKNILKTIKDNPSIEDNSEIEEELESYRVPVKIHKPKPEDV